MHHHHHGGGIRIAAAPGSIVSIVSMFFTGVLLLGMAAVFFVMGSSSRFLYTGFMITAGVLGPTGFILLIVGALMWKKRANGQRLRAQGIPGQARIVGLAQTGLYVNYQPVVELQLEITIAMRPPYVVTRRETVPQIMLGLLTSGRPLPVMVDPAQPNDLVILWEAALSAPAPIVAPPMAFR